MNSSGHAWKARPEAEVGEEEDEEDPLDAMIKKTGCLDQHNNVQVSYNLIFH